MRILSLLFCLLALPGLAEPRPYALDAAASDVAFTYDLNGSPTKGRIPVDRGDVVLDLQNLPASRVTVILNAAAITGGMIIATETLRSADFFDVGNFPAITFQSTGISGTFQNGQVAGDLTIRGVTRPITFAARVLRQAGTEAGDLSKLTVVMTGTLDRRGFGLDAMPRLAGPDITLDIRARIFRK